MAKIRVVLADDHALVIDGLRLHMADTGDIEVVAAVDNGAELIAAVEKYRPDVAVLDLHMPDTDGFSVLEHLRRRRLPVRTLVLTALADGGSLQRAIELEADGIVLKTEPPRQTVAAIRQVAAGQVVYPRAVHNWLLRRASREERAPGPSDALSERELEVLKLIASGQTNQEIAARLHLSPNTIKYHLQNIYRKLQVSNRTEAANYYLKNL